MGEIADDIIDGIFCEWCGEYIGDAVGYPRKCFDCQKEAYEENKKKHEFKKKQK